MHNLIAVNSLFLNHLLVLKYIQNKVYIYFVTNIVQFYYVVYLENQDLSGIEIPSSEISSSKYTISNGVV